MKQIVRPAWACVLYLFLVSLVGPQTVGLQSARAQKAAPEKAQPIAESRAEAPAATPQKSPAAAPVLSFDDLLQADFFQCIQKSDIECVRAYCQLHEGLAARAMVKGLSSTRQAIKSRRTGVKKTEALYILKTLLEFGAPVVENDFLYAYADGQKADAEVLELLFARVEFLRSLRAVYLLHKKHNTDEKFFVHGPLAEDVVQAIESGQMPAEEAVGHHPQQMIPLAPKEMLVYRDRFSGRKWLQSWFPDGFVTLDEVARLDDKREKWQLMQEPAGWKLWMSNEWPAVVTADDLYAMQMAVWKGWFNEVLDIILKNPYVVHATGAVDTNLRVPSAIFSRSLADPMRSFLGEALERGHYDIARLLIEFQAELLPIEKKPGQPAYIAWQLLQKQQKEGLIDLLWQAEKVAPELSRVQKFLSRLPKPQASNLTSQSQGASPALSSSSSQPSRESSFMSGSRLVAGGNYRGASDKVIEKFDVVTDPRYKGYKVGRKKNTSDSCSQILR